MTTEGQTTICLTFGGAELLRFSNRRAQTYNALGNIPIGYAGEYWDAETNFIYLRARYYDPDFSRFITEDPAQDGDDWYGYCGNNPINRIDPSGLYYLEFTSDGRTHAVVEAGDTMSGISQAEVNDPNAYKKISMENSGQIKAGQKVDITAIYNSQYPNPNPIGRSKNSYPGVIFPKKDTSNEDEEPWYKKAGEAVVNGCKTVGGIVGVAKEAVAGGTAAQQASGQAPEPIKQPCIACSSGLTGMALQAAYPGANPCCTCFN